MTKWLGDDEQLQVVVHHPCANWRGWAELFGIKVRREFGNCQNFWLKEVETILHMDRWDKLEWPIEALTWWSELWIFCWFWSLECLQWELGSIYKCYFRIFYILISNECIKSCLPLIRKGLHDLAQVWLDWPVRTRV